MTALVLRAARSTDAGKVGAILSEFIDTTPWMPRIHTRAEDIGFAANMIDRRWVTVAEADAQVAGFSAQEGTELHALYVAEAARGKGIGAALLQAAMTQTDQLTLWTFQANTRAQTFYTRHGFAQKEQTDGARNDEGLPDIRFEWQREAV
ncbi:MAG: GNAT family N-acetyltransferase [Tateyamaria sp.]|uniref:GNAT family N-acetyltransferase n=1 Tax=Tateyamaria sp. TaxID=1929288 RepID=UPI00329D5E43